MIQEMPGDGIVALGFRFGVTQAFGEQFTGALYGVLLFGNMMAMTIEQACQRFAGSLPVHAMLFAPCQTSDQRGTFDQPLRVDNRIVVSGADSLTKCVTLGFNWRREPRFAPAANRHRDHAVYCGVPGRDLCEAFFNHPVKTNIGNGLRRVSQRGQSVQYIAH
ncbi:hypothetical protein D3C75_529440 [compost metagenome]